jgi:hypothetical protein
MLGKPAFVPAPDWQHIIELFDGVNTFRMADVASDACLGPEGVVNQLNEKYAYHPDASFPLMIGVPIAYVQRRALLDCDACTVSLHERHA